MSDELEPMLSSDASALERRLLEAGVEQPSPDVLKQAAAALGVSAGALTVAQTASATTAASISAKAASSGGFALAAKWIAGLALGTTVGVATYQVLNSDAKPEPVRVETTERTSTPTIVAPQPKATPLPEEPTSEPKAPESSIAKSTGAKPQTHKPSGKQRTTTPGYASVSEEVKLIAAARRALADKQPKRALSLLSTYDQRFPRGVMRQEAALLRIKALQHAGDSASAKRMAEDFLDDNPQSPHKSRLNEMLSADRLSTDEE